VISMSKFRRHLVIPLLLTCFLSGCSSWRVQPAPATSHGAPERARITLSDGRVVELRSLEIRGDSVAGFAKAGSRGDTLQTYALADVTEFEVRESETGKTILLGFLVFATLGTVIIVARGASFGAAPNGIQPSTLLISSS